MKKRHIAAVVLGVGIMLSPLGRYALGALRPVEAVSAQDAAAAVRARGRPAVIVLYGPRCPLSQAAFPAIVALSREAEAHGAEILAYSTDDGIDTYLLGGFLAEHHATFAARRIRRWQPGELSSAFTAAGVHIGREWVRPLVAVRARDGRIVYQDQAVTDLHKATQALESVLDN